MKKEPCTAQWKIGFPLSEALLPAAKRSHFLHRVTFPTRHPMTISLRYTLSVLFTFSWIFPLSLLGQSRPVVFYISPDGNDSWSGTAATATKQLRDGPFATFDRARAAIRDAKAVMSPQVGRFQVLVRGGTYRFSRSLLLSDLDSGTPEHPIEWKAYPGERVVLTGGVPAHRFTNITHSAVLKRINTQFQDSILVADLRGQGIRDFGEISQREGAGMELFFHGRRMTMARWPNSGWLRVADVPQTGERQINKGLDREKRFDGVPVGRHYGRIKYDGERPRGWSDDDQIFAHGYWTWDWSDSYQRIQSINPDAHELTFAEPHHHYGYTKNQRYYFLNILEELDQPGEWYLDRKNGLLYFWPPGPLSSSSVTLSVLAEPLIQISNASNVSFQGFTFEQSRFSGIVLRECAGVLVAGCTFRNLGGEAVVVNGGTNCGVRSSDFYELSLGAIRLSGGDRKRLTPANNFAENNHIHHYSSWVRTGQYALILDGVGQRVRHNLIHDAPHEGIYIRGNDHLIEYNEVTRVCQETGDAGALHTGRDFTWRGNIIRYNYWHDLLGPGLHGVMGVYLDDWASGFTVYGNIFYRAGRAMMIGGGRDNLVENNVFVQCAPSVHVDARGLGWAGYYFDGTRSELFDLLGEMNAYEPPYSTRYPELLSLKRGNPALPVNNRVIRNVSYGGRWLDIYDYNAFDASIYTIKDNVIADSAICRRLRKDFAGWDPYYLDIDGKDGYVLLMNSDLTAREELPGNVFMEGDPGFMNIGKKDFRLKDSSQAFRLGFRPLPVDSIGLVRDAFRHRLPAR